MLVEMVSFFSRCFFVDCMLEKFANLCNAMAALPANSDAIVALPGCTGLVLSRLFSCRLSALDTPVQHSLGYKHLDDRSNFQALLLPNRILLVQMPFSTSKPRSEPQRSTALGDFEIHARRVREQRERERAAALAEVFPGLIMAPPPLPSSVKVCGLPPCDANTHASTVPHLETSRDSRSIHEKFQFADEASLSSSSDEEDDGFPRLSSPRQGKRNKANAPKNQGEREPTTLAKLLFRFGFRR